MIGCEARLAIKECLEKVHSFLLLFCGGKGKKIRRRRQKEPCRNPGLNQGPLDLQSNALPTELFRLLITNRMFLRFVKSHPFQVESVEEYSILCVICLILSPNSRPTLSIATPPSSISKKIVFMCFLQSRSLSVCHEARKPHEAGVQGILYFLKENNLYSNSLYCQENLTCNSVIACVGKFTLQSLLPQCMLKFTMRLKDVSLLIIRPDELSAWRFFRTSPVWLCCRNY